MKAKDLVLFLKKMFKRLLPILLLLFATLFSIPESKAQYKRKTKEEKEFYESGKIKKMTRTKTVQSTHIDPFTYFKKTIVHTVEYYENGEVRTNSYKKTRVDKASPGACYEVVVITTSYTDKGKVSHYLKQECDKKRVTDKFYDDTGKLTFIRINYYLS